MDDGTNQKTLERNGTDGNSYRTHGNGREQAGKSRESQRTMEKVLENTVHDTSGEPAPVASILNLADCWLTRSDHESSLLEPGLGSSVPVPVNLAKTWLAGSCYDFG